MRAHPQANENRESGKQLPRLTNLRNQREPQAIKYAVNRKHQPWAEAISEMSHNTRQEPHHHKCKRQRRRKGRARPAKLLFKSLKEYRVREHQPDNHELCQASTGNHRITRINTPTRLHMGWLSIVVPHICSLH